MCSAPLSAQPARRGVSCRLPSCTVLQGNREETTTARETMAKRTTRRPCRRRRVATLQLNGIIILRSGAEIASTRSTTRRACATGHPSRRTPGNESIASRVSQSCPCPPVSFQLVGEIWTARRNTKQPAATHPVRHPQQVRAGFACLPACSRVFWITMLFSKNSAYLLPHSKTKILADP
jgi:hypothetical protein